MNSVGAELDRAVEVFEENSLAESLNVVNNEKDKVVMVDGMLSMNIEGELLDESRHQMEGVVCEEGNAVGKSVLIDMVSLQGEAEPRVSPVVEYVKRLPNNVLDIDTREVDVDGSLLGEADNAVEDIYVPVALEVPENWQMKVEASVEIDEKQIRSDDASEVCFSQYAGDMSKKVNLVVDLNEYSISGGKWSDKRTEIKHVLVDDRASVPDSAEANGVSHFDGFGVTEVQDMTVDDQIVDFNKPKNVQKRMLDPAVSRSGFSMSDLVWGKIRSHPWWPGQVFGHAHSSRKALKYSKEGSFLIAYFGDGTFAWNEVSRLKTFQTHFSQMEKQSSLEAFHHAVDCALDEVAKRIEFGLSCPCLPDEVYSKIQIQIVANSGIKEKSRRRDVRDEYSSVACFEPVKLVDFIKELAKVSDKAVDRLELVIAQAQLLSFYRWKGHPQLAGFSMHDGLLDNDAGISYLGEKKHSKGVIEAAVPESLEEQHFPLGKGKSKVQNVTGRKSKQETTLSKLTALNNSYVSNDDSASAGKSGTKLVSSSSCRKWKADDTMSDDSVVKSRRAPLTTSGVNKSPKSKQSFKIENRISKIAGQLNGATSTVKYGSQISQKNGTERKSRGKSSKAKKSQRTNAIYPEYQSPGEMLSELCLVATKPLKGHNFSVSMLRFFSDFRNSGCKEQFPKQHPGRKSEKKSYKAETIESPKLEYVKDSYWTDRIIEGNPDEQILLDSQNEAEDIMPDTSIGKSLPTVGSEAVPGWSHTLDSKELHGGDLNFEAEEPMTRADKIPAEELSRTALILNFADLDSVPSEANLNKIFSRFGPLSEPETKILKTNRVKVVFKRRVDAETAFSSAGKFSIFGPSLVSYCLKYLPSTPQKTPSPATKRRKKDATYQ